MKLQALRSRDRAPFPVPAHQTGHAIFPHPAFRDLSSRRYRRCRVPLDGSDQLRDPQLPEERACIALPLVPAAPRLLGEELRQPLADVAIQVAELCRRVAYSEVG